MCVERRWKGELELSWGEPNPCIENKRMWEKSSRGRVERRQEGESVGGFWVDVAWENGD